MTPHWTVRGATLALFLCTFAGCEPADPRQAVIEERARWTVSPKGFVETEDGRIKLSISVSGPARSSIEQLSFRIDLRDERGESVGGEWRTIDLASIPMGTGTDLSLTLTSPTEGFAEISIDRVLAPGPDDTPHIKELQF
jgi:hypothetical protein